METGRDFTHAKINRLKMYGGANGNKLSTGRWSISATPDDTCGSDPPQRDFPRLRPKPN